MSGDTSGLHVLTNGLLDVLVKPLLQLGIVFSLLALLLEAYMYMATTRAFFIVDPIMSLIIEDVPQVPLV